MEICACARESARENSETEDVNGPPGDLKTPPEDLV